jgi:transposase
MKTKTYVGLDVHRTLVVATAVNSMGERIRQSSFGPTPKELTRFLSRLPKPTKVVLEACAVWERYYEAEASTGAEVVLSHPRNTRLIAEASLKTDKVDSAALANLLRIDSIPLAYIPSPDIRALRKLYREHCFYARAKSTMMRHAYSRLAERGVDYTKGVLQHRPQRARFRRRQIPEVNRALDALEDMERYCKDIDVQIHAAFLESREAQLLKTIPGIGELTAVSLVGFLCPIERFPTIDKLTSYVGLCPTTHQSANSLYHGKLKPDCNRELRSLLVEVSWTHRQRCRGGSVVKIARRVGRRAGKGKGTIAAAHKLLKIVHAMLKRKEVFRVDAPGPSTATHAVRRRKTTAAQSLRRVTLGPLTANSPSAS